MNQLPPELRMLYSDMKFNLVKLFNQKKEFLIKFKKDMLTLVDGSVIKQVAILLKRLVISEMNILKFLLYNDTEKTKFYFEKFKELSSEFLEEYSQHDTVHQGTYLNYCNKLKLSYDFYIDSLKSQKIMKERGLRFTVHPSVRP
jgi:hypothetical protein